MDAATSPLKEVLSKCPNNSFGGNTLEWGGVVPQQACYQIWSDELASLFPKFRTG